MEQVEIEKPMSPYPWSSEYTWNLSTRQVPTVVRQQIPKSTTIAEIVSRNRRGRRGARHHRRRRKVWAVAAASSRGTPASEASFDAPVNHTRYSLTKKSSDRPRRLNVVAGYLPTRRPPR